MNVVTMTGVVDGVVVSGWVSLWAMVPRALRLVPRPRARPPAPQVPRVSVIVPARNEERLLPRCLSSLQAQSVSPYEIRVVDDDSDDLTATVATQGGARVIKAGPRPPGWTGKPWAAHVGADGATGEWLLFVDADAVLAPDCLATAVAEAEAAGADLLSLLHRPDCGSAFEANLQPVLIFAGLCFVDFRQVNDRLSAAAAAPGSFLLFRRSAYEKIGGHASVKDAIVEDLALARSVKRHGLTLRLLVAPELIFTERRRTASQVCEGWCRVMAGGMADRPAPLVAAALAVMVIFVGPYLLAPLGLPFVALAVAHAVVARAVRAQMKRAYGLDDRWAWLQPLGALVAAALLVRASLTVARDGGRIRWSGREYEP